MEKSAAVGYTVCVTNLCFSLTLWRAAHPFWPPFSFYRKHGIIYFGNTIRLEVLEITVREKSLAVISLLWYNYLVRIVTQIMT